MAALQELIDFCAAETGRRDVVPLPLSLVRLMGSAGGGLFVAQLLVWAEAEGGEAGWVARDEEAWRAATMLGRAELRAAVRRARLLGFLEVGAGRAPDGARRYRLLRAPLLRALVAFLRDEAAGAPPGGRRAARRTVRLPVKAEPAASREGPARQPARQWDEWMGEEMGGEGGAGGGEDGGAALGGQDARAPLGGEDAGAALGGEDGGALLGGQGGGAALGEVFDGGCWEAALAEMRRTVPARLFDRWLVGSRFGGLEGKTVVVAVADVNTAWWVNSRLTRRVERAVNLVAPGDGWLGVEARAGIGEQGSGIGGWKLEVGS
jgi:hypothetical protein